MAKFCGKCGAKLDEKTGKCLYCDKEVISTSPCTESSNKVDKQTNYEKDKTDKKDAKKSKKEDKAVKKKNKKVCIAVISFVAVILAGVITICLLVYKDKLDIPWLNAAIVNIGLKNESSEPVTDENSNDMNSKNENSTTSGDDDVDLKDNYEVPEFDAEKYFAESTDLKSSLEVKSSQSISTEEEAYESFAERGFDNGSVTYEYSMDGKYSGASEISGYSSSQHPMYQTYYTTANGAMWAILEVNGSFFANPIFYNFSDQEKIPVTISETDTITSYDSTTNKFYVNIPDKTKTVIKTVTRINAETLEKLTAEEIDKL